jgi:HAE1 family hydrophobic/amphiphilic exporter-1
MVSAGASDSSGGAISSMFGAKDGANYGKLQMKLFPKDQRKRSTDLIQRLIAEKALKIPGVKLVDFTSTSGANQAMGGGKPISVEIYGFNLDVTDKVAEDLKSKMANVPGIVDLTISRDKGNPEVWFDVDRAKAASLGLTMADIASTLRNNVYGNAITKYRDQGDEYDIFLRLKKENRKTLADLENIFITSRTGKNIALSNIAKVVHKNGPLAIQRKNQERYLTVESNYYKRSVGDINQDVQKIVNKIALPSGVSIKMGGSAEQMKESFSQLGMALILGILLIYLVMVAQFESIIDPFIIMFSVPFAIVGVIWGLFLAGAPFGIMPFIGTIMVVGIVVKNAIVFISYTNILRERGYAVKDAVLDAGKTRLRPILMTTATAILGLLPMALSRGEGAEFWSPLAYAILGGLTVSTLITLILVPVIYTIFEEKIRTKREEELS